MTNAENMTITLLIVTAAVLTSLLVAGYVASAPAYGAVSGVKDGDYVMTVGTYDQDNDFVYVIDTASNRLNLYYVNINTNAVVFRDNIDLSKVFRP
jgi:hypothetical protein